MSAGNALELTPERAREVLARRARELARRPPDLARGGTIDVVEFTIAGERYAVESREVLAVFALATLVPLPGATPPVVGITIWRGTLLTLLDIRHALRLAQNALNDLRNVVVLGDSRSASGILVDAVDGVSTRRLSDFHASHALMQLAHVRGVSAGAVVLIDGIAVSNHHLSGGHVE